MNRAKRKRAKAKKARQETAREGIEREATKRTWSGKSVLAAVIIAVGVIVVPLYLKSTPSSGAEAEPASQAAVASAQTGQALPRFVDLGTTTCIPCKVMLGVMEELKQKYPGAFIVDFVNVKEDPEETQQYKIRIIPTQIFYAPDGRELYRHEGVFRTEEIIAKWAELGFHFTPTAGK
jgi:thioredoxin 1